MWENIDIVGSIKKFVDGGGKDKGRDPNGRYASFDYCFNHFQSFRESGHLAALAEGPHLVESCLHLGFFLASWGMLRGSTRLLWKSARFLGDVVRVIAETPVDVWEIDAHRYDDDSIDELVRLGDRIRGAVRDKDDPTDRPSDILVTKIMLGVFGSTPAFDTTFVLGSRLRTFGPPALRDLSTFYEAKKDAIESVRKKLSTFDFLTGEPTGRPYTRAKVIDMVFWVEGQERQKAAAGLGTGH